MSSFEPRWYREELHRSSLSPFAVRFRETDLWIAVPPRQNTPALRRCCEETAASLWQELHAYILKDPLFLHSLTPHTPHFGAPPVALKMAAAAAKADVGPMAAVAGAFAEEVAQQLMQKFKVQDIIVENGGDIYLATTESRRIAIWAGPSPLSGKLALELEPNQSPLSLCTSSATVGPSLSLGQADAVTISAKSGAVADAYATAVGNQVRSAADIETSLAYADAQEDILGCVIVIGDRIGAIGEVRLSPL
ncbi:MAG: UPF0280 family protein [Negativicutes bacterium]|nr:UPF0280 family protein [Negativicutes bacterium]